MEKIILASILFSFLILPAISLAQVNIGDITKCTPCISICLERGYSSSDCVTCVTQRCLGNTGGTSGVAAPPASLDVMTMLERIVDWLFSILLVFAAIFIIIAAFYFVTAAGNPETVSKARNFVLYALIGVAVAVASRGLVALVRRIVGS